MDALPEDEGTGEGLEIRKVGVVGCGLMGSGVAEVAARGGFEVVVRELNQELLERGEARIRKSLDRAVEREKATRGERDAAWARLAFTTELSALADRDIIIEAVVERLDAKRDLFMELDSICAEHTIFASNTSSLTITDHRDQSSNLRDCIPVRPGPGKGTHRGQGQLRFCGESPAGSVHAGQHPPA
jgi:3-hydroxyacyl-CoA dehydrogenase